MIGATIPYHLRPHKAVDRRLFVDLLLRLERWRSISDYAYISMGGYPMEDHRLVHRIVGIEKLVAFDYDQDVVDRQKFNRPIDACRCVSKKSGEIVSNLDAVLDECGFADAEGLIVWLDYTSRGEIGEQVREFEALLNTMRAGDIVRVTVNAHLSDFFKNDSRPIETVEKRRPKALDYLKERIGDFMPSWAKPEHMTEDGLPKVLAGSFMSAALKAIPIASGNTFLPLSLVRYADGQQMLSMTGIVIDRASEAEFAQKVQISAWPFFSKDWQDIHQLIVADLTIRERLFLQRDVVSRPVKELIDGLGFSAAGGVPLAAFIENYKKYYRFYPSLLTAEI